MAGASSTSADVPGFRIERRLGDEVWEATQLELGRRVALRRLAPGVPFDVSRWPQRPGVVALYAVMATADGTYVATRFVPGARTLAEAGRTRGARRRRWLDEVQATLAGGDDHGDLTEHDILIDPAGRALVTGFGRPRCAPDTERLEAMRAGDARRRLPWAAATAALLLLAVAAALVLSGDKAPPRAPGVTDGATEFGSALAPGGVRTVDCEGNPPSGSSLSCTILQTDLRGRPLVVPFRGLVRGWAVRGARGPMRLQILRRTAGGYVLFNASRTRTIPGPDALRVIPADRTVPKGAQFALEVAPGAAVGLRSGVAGAGTARFFGPVTIEPRTPAGTTWGEELLLRVDVVRRPG